MKRVLITGASGFIGSHLVEEGLIRGYEVWAAVRAESSRQYLTDPRIRFAELELSSPERLVIQLEHLKAQGLRFDYIIHAAGATRARSGNEFQLINYRMTVALVNALINARLVPDCFIFISSLAAIGPGNPVTMEPISDLTPPHPIDSYGRSKRAAECFLESLSGFPWIILRPTGVYGPRERDYLQVYRTIAFGLELYAGTSDQRISFIFIRDLVNLTFRALESGYTGKRWVVSDGCNYSAGEFSAMIRKILGRTTIPITIPAFLVRTLAAFLESVSQPFGRLPVLNREKALIITSRNWQCDPAGFFRDLAVFPAYDLHRGLEETIRWCRMQRWI